MTADQLAGRDRTIPRRSFLRGIGGVLLGGVISPLVLESIARAERKDCIGRSECLKENQAGFMLTGSIYKNLNGKPGFQPNEGDQYSKPATGQEYLLVNKQNPKQYTVVRIDPDGIARDSKGCDVFVFSGGADSKIRVSNGSDQGALTIVARRSNAYDLSLGAIVKLGDPVEINSALGCEAKICNLRIDERYLVAPTQTATPAPTSEKIPTLTPTPAVPPYQLPGRSRAENINVPIAEGEESLGVTYGLIVEKNNPWFEDPMFEN